MNVRPVYKCHLCNAVFEYGNSVETPYEELPRLLGKVVQNQMFMNNPALYQFPMHIFHSCRDGKGAGLAQFIGFKEVSNE